MPRDQATMNAMSKTPSGAMLNCAFEVNRMAEQLARTYRLTARDVLAVMEVAMCGPFSASELADRTYLTRGAVTGMVRRLSEGGWLESASDPRDGRRLVIRSTERPMALLEQWMARYNERIASRVGDEQVDSVAQAFSHCTDELEQHRGTLQMFGPGEVRAIMQSE